MERINEFLKYEFRCSALGKIISKSGKLTDANKTYLQEVFIGILYGIQKEFTTKYFEKGKYCEEDGITMLNDALYKGTIVIKNKERKHNGYIHGEKDTRVRDKVWDIKNAYDRFTFGKASLTWDYEWQLRGYAWLDDVTESGLFYCLNNMPEHLIVQEERMLFYRGGYATYDNPQYLKACTELREFHNYDNMPLWDRFKTWDVECTKEHIDTIKECVVQGRQYLKDLYITYVESVNKNKSLMGIKSILIAEHDKDVNATIIQKGK